MGDVRDHWEKVYTAKAEAAVSWYQPHAARSLELIEAASPEHTGGVIDVGGGASTLVDDLIARGFIDLTVLDVAAPALEQAKERLGPEAARIAWIVADITAWNPPRTWHIWHDRAVFHFLTAPLQQDAYISALTKATAIGARVVISTFAPDGPNRCSGLPVLRYSPGTLAARLGSHFELIGQAKEAHVTPRGSEQRFSYSVLRRR